MVPNMLTVGALWFQADKKWRYSGSKQIKLGAFWFQADENMVMEKYGSKYFTNAGPK